MSFDQLQQGARFAWYPSEYSIASQKNTPWHIACDYLSTTLNPEAWQEIKPLIDPVQGPSATQLLRIICKWDQVELIELLYSKYPKLFLTSHQFFVPNKLFLDAYAFPENCEGSRFIIKENNLISGRLATLTAVCLCALYGATCCLEYLLEQGADPNGLDCPNGWSYFKLAGDQIMPVTPLDCAELAGQDDSCLTLEIFGGKTLLKILDEEQYRTY